MTRQRSFKERIRARMEKTGESYTTARRKLIEKSETRAQEAKTPKTISGHRPNNELVIENTGRGRDEWMKLLDEWGATSKKHPEIVKWLTNEHGVSGWWAQSLTVSYEQERGMRAPGQRADGSYSATATKTVNVDVSTLFKAFKDPKKRTRWMGDADLEVRTTRPDKSLTARWEGGSTRITVSFEPKGDAKSQIALAHEKIADAKQADELKTFWRERLVQLKEMLEE